MRALSISAGFVTIALGCGNPDAIDHLVDATPTIDGAVGPRLTTVTVLGLNNPGFGLPGLGDLRAGLPMADVDVVFVAPTGQSIATKTDRHGVAAAESPSGSAVFVIRDPLSFAVITAFADVPAGAALVDGAPPSSPVSSQILGVRHAMVAGIGANFYQLQSSCNTSAPSGGSVFSGDGSFEWQQARCVHARDASVVVTATAFDGGLIGYSHREHVDLEQLVEFAMPAIEPSVPSTVIATNIPASVTTISVQETHGDRDLSAGAAAAALVEGSSVVLQFPVAPIGSLTSRWVQFGNGRTRPVTLVTQQLGVVVNTVIDVGAQAMPFVGQPSVGDDGSLSWSYVGGGGRRPDVMIISLGYVGGSVDVALRVVAPGARTEVRLPMLPEPFAQLSLVAPHPITSYRAFDLVDRSGFANTVSIVNVSERDVDHRPDPFGGIGFWMGGDIPQF
jgi:hypothetical protein